MNTITNQQAQTEFFKIFTQLVQKEPTEQIYFDSDLETFTEAVNQIHDTGDFDRDFIPEYIEKWLLNYKHNLLINNNVA